METPIKNKPKAQNNSISIPPSPMMKKLGYGTGVAVYRLERSPISNKTRSPWALKKTIKSKTNKIELTKRIQQEAKILSKLKHPNIVGFRALVKFKSGDYCLAMEDCSKSLGDLIEIRFDNRMDMFPAENIKKVALDVSKALSYLHDEALILHSDIKSYNILVKGDFEICKLCDFGVALTINKDGMFEKENSEEEYIGTPPWCSPEVLRLDQIITTKADIYALGLVLWEMLELSIPPLPDNNDSFEFEEADLQIRQRPCVPNCEYGDEYKVILEIYYCCTEADYTKRPNAKDLLCVLESDRNGIGSS